MVFCEHNRKQNDCVQCGGSMICVHKKRKRACIECSGACIHRKLKNLCVDCGGSSVCEHGKNKFYCTVCKNPKVFCEHGREKRRCKNCENATGLCPHQKQRQKCKDCGGTQICVHSKQKSKCKECGGSELCKTSLCTIRAIKKFNGYCLSCCTNVHPELITQHNIRTKELKVLEFLQLKFPVINWISNKTFGACSQRRPDILGDFGSHVLIIEIDEGQHEKYDTTCENKRIMEISQDIAHRPLIVVRFNPDSFMTHLDQKVKSPWILNGRGILSLSNHSEWNLRCNLLADRTKFWCENVPEKTVTLEYLFFNGWERNIEPEMFGRQSICNLNRRCEHNKDKYYCKLCQNPTVFCEHKNIKNNCNDCGGSSLCEHGKNKYYCKVCQNPSVFCEHKHIKKTCKDCNTEKYCEHKNIKKKCYECYLNTEKVLTKDESTEYCKQIEINEKVLTKNTKQTEDESTEYCKQIEINEKCSKKYSKNCEHGKLKNFCVDCGGSSLCEHGKNKYYCKLCQNPSVFCEHTHIKKTCKVCNTDKYCEHKNIKKKCYECNLNTELKMNQLNIANN